MLVILSNMYEGRKIEGFSLYDHREIIHIYASTTLKELPLFGCQFTCCIS